MYVPFSLLSVCSVWEVIWKESVFWKRQRQIVPMMGQGKKWKCRKMMTNMMFGFASVTSIQQYVACSELPASERMEISALPQYLKTRYLTANKQTNKKILTIFHSWWINKIWLPKLALATQMSSGIFFDMSMYGIHVRYVPFQFILSHTAERFLNFYSLKQLLNWKQCLF